MSSNLIVSAKNMEGIELNNFESSLERQPKKILEIGAGFRSIVELLKSGGKDIGYSIISDFDKSKVTNEDTVSSLVEMAQPKNRELQRIVADAYNLPFKDKSFDYIVAMNFFGDSRIVKNDGNYNETNNTTVESLFKELARVLSPGGEVCVIETYTPDVAQKLFLEYKDSYDKYFSYVTQSEFVSSSELFKTFYMFEGDNHFVHSLKKKGE